MCWLLMIYAIMRDGAYLCELAKSGGVELEGRNQLQLRLGPGVGQDLADLLDGVELGEVLDGYDINNACEYFPARPAPAPPPPPSSI